MRKSTWIASLSFFALLVGASVFSFFRFFKEPMPESGGNWMTNLSDDKQISLLSIPGSHDSGARHSIIDVAGICQDLTIEEQLNAGVRFFDIRLRANKNDLMVCHGYIDQGITFSNVRDSFRNFLKEHPGEGLFVSVKEEQDPADSTKSFDELLRWQIDDDSYWYLDNAIPDTLGEIRGKAVLISRYFDSTIGIPAASGWRDPPEAEKNNTFGLPVGDGVLEIQDHYKLKTIDDKKAEFQALLDRANSYTAAELAADTLANKQKLFVNFASGYLDGKIPPTYSLSVAPEMNKYVAESVKNVSNTGIVLLDFVTAELCQKIYEVNAR
ncbi:MAG: phosphatidylinositol-specific phospholipase C [Bacilli bacterium]|nr:phosphatidylinositol-specific phospholipase C [Bacilli bacterium]